MDKSIQAPEQIIASLINLKEELITRQAHDLVCREILFKINSCLYSKYPHNIQE